MTQDIYSPAAGRVRDALMAGESRDPAVEALANAVGQAITQYDAGFIGQGPIGSFLFLVPPGVSMGRLLGSLSQAWLGGKTWDGSPSYFHINCSPLTGFDQRVLTPLVGGPLDGSRGMMFSRSQLAQFSYPHFAIRAGGFLRDVENWRTWFLESDEYAEDLKNLRFRKKMDEFHQSLAVVIEEAQQEHHEELAKESAFRSVVVFDGLSAGSYFGLINIIGNIVETGTQAVWPNTMLDFSHSLIIAIVYDDFERGELGFMTPGKTGATLGPEKYKELHAQGCEWLRQVPSFAGLVRMMGDSIFVLHSKSSDDQRVHVLAAFQEMKEWLQKVDIEITWSDVFVDLVLEHTNDEALRSYTDSRLRSALDQYILYPIAQHVLGEELQAGSELHFDIGEKGAECRFGKIGEGKILRASDISDVLKAREIGAKHFDPSLIGDEAASEGTQALLKRIHEGALEIMGRLS